MRNILLTVVFLTTGHIQAAKASALSGPVCFVKAQIVNSGIEGRRLDSGRDHESSFINLKVIEVSKGRSCPVAKDQVYRATDNHPGVFKKGDIVQGGFEPASSMGPNGPVNFLQWSQLTYEDGTPIINITGNNSARIDFLQSNDKPIEASSINKAAAAFADHLVGQYPKPDGKYPFTALSRLNKNNQAGIFNTEGYVAYIAPDLKCGRDCAGGPTSYIVISESRRTFRQPSFQCSAREIVVSFPTDIPVWELFKLGGKYKFTLKIIRLGPRDIIIYHYDMLPKPKLVAEPIGIEKVGGN